MDMGESAPGGTPGHHDAECIAGEVALLLVAPIFGKILCLTAAVKVEV